MTNPNPNPVFRNRKGIHTHLDGQGSLVCDERWQFVAIGADYIEFDNEATRPAPFPEPRQDAVTWTMRRQPGGLWTPDTLAIHSSTGRREARVNWSAHGGAEQVHFCWQHGSDVKRFDRPWQAPMALGFRSAFFMSALLHALPAGDAVAIDFVWLSTVSFAPLVTTLRVSRLGRAVRPTHFGPRPLEGFGLSAEAPDDAEAAAMLNGSIWRDDGGIIQEWLGADGSCARLTAVN